MSLYYFLITAVPAYYTISAIYFILQLIQFYNRILKYQFTFAIKYVIPWPTSIDMAVFVTLDGKN